MRVCAYKAGFFGAPQGGGITNPGGLGSENIVSSRFIPPESEAQGVLTVNGERIICASGR